MRGVLTAWFLLTLAGCTSKPAERSDQQDDSAMPTYGLFGLGSASPRVGVEHLPPAEEEQVTLTVDSIHPDDVDVPSHLMARYKRPREEEDDGLGWDLEDSHINAIECPVERFAMSFMRGLIGEDRRRVERAIGTPVLSQNLRGSSRVPQHFYDERAAEDHLEVLRRQGTRMVERPFLNSLKALTPITDAQLSIRPFDDAENAGSGHWGQHKPVDFGELTLRIRPVNFNDPMDLTYTIRGVRLGTGKRHLRFGISHDLWDNLRLSFRSDYDYLDESVYVFGSLRYRLDDHTRAKLLVGNSIDLLTHPASYPGQPPEEDRSQGVLFFVEHMF